MKGKRKDINKENQKKDRREIWLESLEIISLIFNSLLLSILVFRYMYDYGIFNMKNGTLITWIVIGIIIIGPVIMLLLKISLYWWTFKNLFDKVFIVYSFIVLLISLYIIFWPGIFSEMKNSKSTSSQLQSIQSQLSGLIKDVNKINNICK